MTTSLYVAVRSVERWNDGSKEYNVRTTTPFNDCGNNLTKRKVYIVDLRKDEQSWQIARRYSQFLELHQWLVKAFPDQAAEFPPFPGKAIFTSENNPALLENRCAAFDLYLKHLCTLTQCTDTFEVKFFLCIPCPPLNLRVLCPLPDNDFDTTEVTVPWKILTLYGFDVVFATEHGATPHTDATLVRPEGVVFGQLGADLDVRLLYRELEQYPRFMRPLTYRDIVASDYVGLLCPGGHAQGMRQYLESEILRSKLVDFWRLSPPRPVAAICHGTLLLARCCDRSAAAGEKPVSILHHRRTTSLPKFMENLGYTLTFWKFGRRYRTYDMHCADEVCAALADPERQFERGPLTLGAKGTVFDSGPAFVVEDGNYISARWPGDAYLFGRRFVEKLLEFIKEKAK